MITFLLFIIFFYLVLLFLLLYKPITLSLLTNSSSKVIFWIRLTFLSVFSLTVIFLLITSVNVFIELHVSKNSSLKYLVLLIVSTLAIGIPSFLFIKNLISIYKKHIFLVKTTVPLIGIISSLLFIFLAFLLPFLAFNSSIPLNSIHREDGLLMLTFASGFFIIIFSFITLRLFKVPIKKNK